MLASTDDLKFTQAAVEKSKDSVSAGGFPVGTVIVRNGEIITSGTSNGKQLNDPTNHAEIAAIREACQKLQTRDLMDCVLYSSLEPCLMCFSASIWASIPKIVYACSRKLVSGQHYEGNHDLNLIDKLSRKPIELIHFSELENQALRVIEDWEKTQKSV